MGYDRGAAASARSAVTNVLEQFGVPKGGMLRKSGNSGVFAVLPERMTKKHIREVAKEYGVSLRGIKLLIDADEEKLSEYFGYSGRADPLDTGRIDFFPMAFSSKEELLRTLYHERVHVMQFKEFGGEYVQLHRAHFEDLAYAAENEFIAKLKKEGRL